MGITTLMVTNPSSISGRNSVPTRLRTNSPPTTKNRAKISTNQRSRRPPSNERPNPDVSRSIHRLPDGVASRFRSRALSIGVMVSATIRETTTMPPTVRINSRNSREIMPETKRKGTKRVNTVRVPAITGSATSCAPSAAASLRSGRSAPVRAMFSITTMELSSTIPMATTSPPNEKIFREKPPIFIRTKLPIKVSGRATSITKICRKLPKNR